MNKKDIKTIHRSPNAKVNQVIYNNKLYACKEITLVLR